MSGSLNKVILVGNLGRDPEVRAMQSGDKVANLNIATSERWKDKDGQPQEKTEWHRVVVFGRIAEVAEQYLRKGSKVLIEGKLQTRKWTDNQGAEKYTTEIVVNGFSGQMTMLDRASSDRMGGGDSGGFDNSSYDRGMSDGPNNASDGFDDEIPF